jgi:hypothetical protein
MMKKNKKRFRFSYTSILLLIWISPLHPQSNNLDSTDSYIDSRIKEVGNQINYSLDDGVRLFNTVADFDKKDWIYSAALLLGTAASFSLDTEIKDIAARNQNSTMNSITNIGEKYGNGVYVVLLSAGLFTTGLLFESQKVENTGRILFEGLLVSGALVQVIKIVSGRSRPYLDEGPFMFNFFETDFDHTSFPSGHTIVAFTTSSVLAATIKNSYASIALYSLAGLTAYQRIYSNNHWFSDTVLAAIIGTVVGNALVKINEDRANEEDDENKFSINPSFNHLGLQIKFSMKL